MGKNPKAFGRYRYAHPVPAVPGGHGEMSAIVKRASGGWMWVALENDRPFKKGQNAALDDAQRSAICHLNRLLADRGARLLTENPGDWVGEDSPASLIEDIKKTRQKSAPPWRKRQS
jgi:hypothetical protein